MLYHRSFTIGWMCRSTLGTCERGGFLAFSHNPCKITLRARAPTELSMGWFWTFPIWSHSVTSHAPIFRSLHSFCPWSVLSFCASHRVRCTCAFLYMNFKYIIKASRPVSPLLPSPCGTARKSRVLIELSSSIAYPLPASCPQALGYSF